MMTEREKAVQRPLPRRHGILSGVAPFAHPAEQEVARILDFFGLRWSYEPTAFMLRQHEDGRVAEMMTPDFYLPDLNVYLELTTMRQRLISGKNRKARLMRERYPGVNLKVLYRADYQRLVQLYRGWLGEHQTTLATTVFLSRQEIDAAAGEMAVRILARCERLSGAGHGLPTLLISDPGSRVLLADLTGRLHACGVPVASGELRFARIGDGGRIRPVRSTSLPVRGEPVILLETLVSTGMHLGHVQRWMSRRGVDLLDTMALCARPGARMLRTRLDYVAHEAPNSVLAGYGLRLRSELADRGEIVTVRAPQRGPVMDLLSAS